MTLTLAILIFLLTAVLLLALHTLRKRNRSGSIPLVVASPRLRPANRTSYGGLPVALSTTLTDDLVIASLFQPQAIPTEEGGKHCGDCSRNFDEHSHYCYIDGYRLGASSSITSSISIWVCTSCGHEGSEACGCEDGVFKVHAENIESIPMIPSARCSMCQSLGQLGSVCETDNIERTAIFDLNFQTFPPHGFGPRRSICLECGAQFSAAARFCSADGHRLSLLN